MVNPGSGRAGRKIRTDHHVEGCEVSNRSWESRRIARLDRIGETNI